MRSRLWMVGCVAWLSFACTAEVDDETELTAPDVGAEEVGESSEALRCPDGEIYRGVSGQRIKSPDSPRVYVVDGEGRKRWIPNVATYQYLYGRGTQAWDAIITTSATDCILNGSPMVGRYQSPTNADAHLLKEYNWPAVYVFVDGERRWIPSAEVFNKYGFSPHSITEVTYESIRHIPLGSPWD